MSETLTLLRFSWSLMLLWTGTSTGTGTGEKDADPQLWYRDLCRYNWEVFDHATNVNYTLRLCSEAPPTACGSDVAVCLRNISTGQERSVGNLSPQILSGSVLDFNSTDKCPGGETNVQSSVSFQCGKTLGSPELVAVSQCVHYFEWKTYTVCTKDKFKAHAEVPCHVFDSDGNKHDLSPLIKGTDAYLVDDGDDNVDFYINICRNINSPEKLCPQDSAACVITSQGSFSVGSPIKPLELLSSHSLRIQYEFSADSAPPAFCEGHTPAVSISFICPSSRHSGSVPRMVAETNCRYEVEWVTEYACHRDFLLSHSCTLTSSQHHVDVDLTPLSLSSTDQPYYAHADGYVYYLNVCGRIPTDVCGTEDPFLSSCQVKKDKDMFKVSGRNQNQTLRYSDGDLTLIYPDGARCSSGFLRMTIINFQCNSTAGRGQPVFAGETDCTYFFDWQTAFACVKEKAELLCSFRDGNKHYDLSPLTRYPGSGSGSNWEVLDSNKQSKTRFYLNVCHRVLPTNVTTNACSNASICAVGQDGSALSLGGFLTAPQRTEGGDVRLLYGEGSPCPGRKTPIQSVVTLKCRPGDLQSPPVLVRVSSDGCMYELEWFTSAACVLAKSQGEECRVEDPQAGFSFDLSPLSKPDGDFYNLSSGGYTYYINVCAAVKAGACPQNAGACQVEKSSWSLGVANARLSYYDGLIQLSYANGSEYNNQQHTQRSTLLSFLCDPEAGTGTPEFQVEDDYTYNFRWYTSYACPQRPHECVVTDPTTLDQYDLSSLSRSGSSRNWQVMDLSDSSNRRKYYINVCRPVVPVIGCDRNASVCQMKYVMEQGSPQEVVSVANMGVSRRGPIIEARDRLLLEFSDGSACESDGLKLSYTTRIHLVCSRGTLASGPRFLMLQNCTANFLWETRAACAIRTAKNNSCAIVDPDTGFEFNLQPLASPTGYTTTGNGKHFLVNICENAAQCGAGMAGCELEDGRPSSVVGVERTLQFSTDGVLTLTYRGPLDDPTATRDSFTVTFVCSPDEDEGSLKMLHEELGTFSSHVAHDVLFQFSTALACRPAPVDCTITDSHGNEYDLSHLMRNADDAPWIPIDPESTSSRSFFINVCKPLPTLRGCPVGPLGACAVIEGKSLNLGFVQSTPRVAEDGSVSIVYRGGDKCSAKARYSTRIIFQCHDNTGSPMFDRLIGCEYVFIWRTSEACPIRKSQGDNCHVTDPRSGAELDLSALRGRDYVVQPPGQKYTYHLSVCGALQGALCKHGGAGAEAVSSCQVDENTHRIAGMSNQTLTLVGDQIILNYTHGETCHRIYQRSTEIYFSCHPHRNPGEPEFLKETPECTYLFSWPTALACAPVESSSCSYNDGHSRSFDLSPLTLDSRNWEVEVSFGTNKTYYINVCRSLVPQAGFHTCQPGAASCMKTGSEHVSLGHVMSGPSWEGNLLTLHYGGGGACPDGRRNISSVIRFKCDADKVDSRPTLISEVEECVYNFLWLTAAACQLNATQHDDCRVNNPATGHMFDLGSLTKVSGYTVFDHQNRRRMFRLNVCGNVSEAGCEQGSAVCVKEGSSVLSAGLVSRKLSFKDHVVELTYEGGALCSASPAHKHRSVITFICRPASLGSTNPEPVLIDYDADTCTYFFSVHTELVCEQPVKCSVQNKDALIDLTPLIHVNGFYTATDDSLDQSDGSPDFYINVCQPLNSIAGVPCPPGSSVCMDPDNGPPVDIGRSTDGPQVNIVSGEVSITYSSSTPCAADPALNYSSSIVFSCQRGIERGSPRMAAALKCHFVFTWATSLLCSDSTQTNKCNLTDTQLQFTFDLSRLKGEEEVQGSSGVYHLSVCGSLSGSCSQSSVCLISAESSLSFGNSLVQTMDYKHEEEAVLLQYGEGDACPSAAGKRQSSFLFLCDPAAGRGTPTLLSETAGCSATFQWKTDVVCPPRRMECKLVSRHRTFDLRGLSSLTEPWKFSHRGDAYYINLCQGVHGGLLDCPNNATVCRRPAAGGRSQTLGRVYTQKMSYSDGKISVSYSSGDDVCGNGVKAMTVIELTCGSTVGHPALISVDEASCRFLIGWETRSACAVKQQEVKMENGTIHVPNTGTKLSLGPLYFSYHQASGDIRKNGDRYIYHIQLSGITNHSLPSCVGANICQDKVNNLYRRRIGSSTQAKYFVKGANLDVMIPSESACGRERNRTVSSTIMFYCSPSAGVGIPEFMRETDECQYLFLWHTDTVCGLITVDTQTDDGGADADDSSLWRRSQAVGVVLIFLFLGVSMCLLGLLLHKKERRDRVMQRVAGCCRRGNQVSYKYSKVNMDEEGEEEMEWLMEELEAPPTSSSLSSGRGGNHGNGHIRTKPVNTDGLRSFSLDEQEDSEDEVLSVPGVRVLKAANQSAFLQEESDEDLVGLLDDADRRRRSSRPRPTGRRHDNRTTATVRRREEDDSDEDLLRV